MNLLASYRYVCLCPNALYTYQKMSYYSESAWVTVSALDSAWVQVMKSVQIDFHVYRVYFNVKAKEMVLWMDHQWYTSCDLTSMVSKCIWSYRFLLLYCKKIQGCFELVAFLSATSPANKVHTNLHGYELVVMLQVKWYIICSVVGYLPSSSYIGLAHW